MKKFNRYDRKFEAKLAYKPYDPVREERKLKLLSEKRELLNRLINVHKVAEYSSNNSSYNNSNNNYSNQDARSVVSSNSRSSSASRSSNASYATFGVVRSQVGGGNSGGENSSNAGVNRSAGSRSGVSGRPPIVPRLKVGGL